MFSNWAVKEGAAQVCCHRLGFHGKTTAEGGKAPTTAHSRFQVPNITSAHAAVQMETRTVWFLHPRHNLGVTHPLNTGIIAR